MSTLAQQLNAWAEAAGFVPPLNREACPTPWKMSASSPDEFNAYLGSGQTRMFAYLCVCGEYHISREVHQ